MKQTWKASHPVEALTPHPDNPRRGDVGAIQDSISAHGFYGAILAQQSSGRIIAGEHRWQAAQAEGLTKVPVVLIDCDDAEAVKIMLADNRTSDVGSYDAQALASLLADQPSLTGTGYTDKDLAALLDETPAGFGDLNTDPIVIESEYQVLVECDGDAHHRKTIAALTEQGYRVRASLA